MQTLTAPNANLLQTPTRPAFPQRVVVDLSGVQTLSAVEISRLARAARENSRKGSEFVLSGVNSRLQSLLESVRFHRLALLESDSAPVRRAVAIDLVA